MPKLTKTIELWDTDRLGNSVIYHYITPELSEDDKPHREVIDEEELLQFILDFEMADHTDMAALLLYDAWEDVKDRYWDEVLEQRLMSSYEEAMAYIQSYIDKAGRPVTDKELNKLYRNVRASYGISLGKEVA